MVFKMGNPGCACCDTQECPCACYGLNNNADDDAGSNNLTGVDTPAFDASTKILGTHSAKFDSSGYFEKSHANCFSPSANSGGWAMWFWIKSLADSTGGYIGSSGDQIEWYPGVITKGHFTYRRNYSSFACDTNNWDYRGGEGKGEWMIFMAGTEIQFWVHTKNGTGAYIGPCGYDLSNYIAVGAQDMPATSEWHFFYWYIKGDDSWLFAYNESGFIDRFHENLKTIAGTSINAGGINANGNEPLHIGVHKAQSNSYGTISNGPEQRLGDATNGGKFRIDTIGFCTDPGDFGDTSDPTPFPIVRPTLADNLWNSGSGRECPYGG